MATLLPPYIDRNCKSSAEKFIFEVLKNGSFSKDWIILHSLNLSQHTIRLYGEIDFLLLIPGGGIFIMEVKGGDIKCVNGVWHFIDRFGNTYRNKSPFNQAREAMFSLHKSIVKEFGKHHKYSRIQMGFFCTFPNINFDEHSVEYEPWQILDKDRLTRNSDNFFKNLILEFRNKNRNEEWYSETDSLPNRSELEEICGFLRGDFEKMRSYRDKIIEFDGHVKSYTKEQFKLLDSVFINEKCFIQGSAGTGKTMIAIESAIRSASQGKTVFLTCFNRLIGEWMQKQIVGYEKLITVSSLHSYLFEKSSGFNYDKSQTNKQDFYSRYLPELLGDMFKKGIFNKYEKLIIDEGQDLIKIEYLNLFDSMINGGLTLGNWEVYGDFEKQAIFSNLSKDEMILLLNNYGYFTKFLLRINCRNTKQIGLETSLLSGFDQPPFLLEYLEGVAVEYVFYESDAHQAAILDDKLTKMCEDEIPKNEVIVLSNRKYESSCSILCKRNKIREIRNANEISEKDDYFSFSTTQAYKGMESNYVIISDIKELAGNYSKSLLYIGMSRARFNLTLLLSESVRSEYRDLLKRKLN